MHEYIQCRSRGKGEGTRVPKPPNVVRWIITQLFYQLYYTISVYYFDKLSEKKVQNI